MYLKMLDTPKKHLVPEQDWDGATTLCGCTVTTTHALAAVNGLAGDECPLCAARAFDTAREAHHRCTVH